MCVAAATLVAARCTTLERPSATPDCALRGETPASDASVADDTARVSIGFEARGTAPAGIAMLDGNCATRAEPPPSAVCGEADPPRTSTGFAARDATVASDVGLDGGRATVVEEASDAWRVKPADPDSDSPTPTMRGAMLSPR
jgi:hypothetical protein